MDKITKFLLGLSKKERLYILDIMQKILILNLDGLDIKKITGEKDLYRIRKGKIRIVFKKLEKNGIIIDLNYRDKIYKNY